MTLSINSKVAQLGNAFPTLKQNAETAMQRLSSGQRINSAGDSVVDISQISTLRADVAALSTTIKALSNARSLFEAADVGLTEITDLLQLMKSLALEASSTIASTATRVASNDEMNQLRLAIGQIATSTTFNGIDLLDGSFSSQTLRVGPSSTETMSVTLASVNSSALGSYVLTGTTRDATAAATSAAANSTTVSEDIAITVNSVSNSIAATANDSAESTATKINAVTEATGVTAKARTYALIASTNGSLENYSVKINGSATSEFAISSTSVSAAVTAINALTPTTGITASATSDFKVLLNDPDGGDITIENESSGSSLTVQAVKYDGVTTQGSAVSLQANNSNDATRVIGTLRLISDATFNVTQSGTASQAYLATGTAALSSLDTLDTTTVNNALDALELIDSAINQVASETSTIGAHLSRIENATSFLIRTKDTSTRSISNLLDADVALESARLAKATMLQKANAALLAQTNSDKDLLLSMIRSAVPSHR